MDGQPMHHEPKNRSILIRPALILAAFLAGLITGMCGFLQAGDFDWSRGWSKADTERALGDTLATAADWAQTRGIVADENFHETSPILGRSPSMRRVDTHFPVVMVLKPLVAWLLPPDWRPAFQWIAISVEAGAVAHNARLGVQMNFK